MHALQENLYGTRETHTATAIEEVGVEIRIKRVKVIVVLLILAVLVLLAMLGYLYLEGSNSF